MDIMQEVVQEVMRLPATWFAIGYVTGVLAVAITASTVLTTRP